MIYSIIIFHYLSFYKIFLDDWRMKKFLWLQLFKYHLLLLKFSNFFLDLGIWRIKYILWHDLFKISSLINYFFYKKIINQEIWRINIFS